MKCRCLLRFVALASLAPAVSAAENESPARQMHHSPTVWLPADAPEYADAARGGNAGISKVIYVNGCWDGGCSITVGANNALADSSTIPRQGSTLSTFEHSVEVWNDTIECLKEVYGPYGVTIVDSLNEPDPADTTTPHHEAILAGLPEEIGQVGQALGVALYGCEPVNNVISFSFANKIGASPIDLCWTVAQESAHSFGLDHAFDCLDPMTYIPGCGQKFFRNEFLQCGEYSTRSCRCGNVTQNSHSLLRAVLGPGTPPPPPTVAILRPTDGETLQGEFSLEVAASDARLVDRLELVINGWVYSEVAGHGYEDREKNYTIAIPSGLPDSVMNLEIRAYNDLDSTASSSVTVTKGGPCNSADVCLAGQVCESGVCLYPPPEAELGDSCERDMECVSLSCMSEGGDNRCSQKCLPGIPGQCPDHLECRPSGPDGFCWPATGGGCCSAGAGRGPCAGQIALFLLCLVALGWRGRRRQPGAIERCAMLPRE